MVSSDHINVFVEQLQQQKRTTTAKHKGNTGSISQYWFRCSCNVMKLLVKFFTAKHTNKKTHTILTLKMARWECRGGTLI